MQRKVILDAPLVNVTKLGFLHVGAATGTIAEFGFSKGVFRSVPFECPEGHQFRVRLELEPIDARPREERELERCRRALESHLGSSLCGGDVFATALVLAIEDLVSARVARALRVHCDADHELT